MLADPCLGLQNLQKGATLARRRAAGVNGEESFTSLPSRLGRDEIWRCAMGRGPWAVGCGLWAWAWQ